MSSAKYMQESLTITEGQRETLASNKKIASADNRESWLAAPWRWSCILLVCLAQRDLQPSDRLLLVAPNTAGLQLLGEIDAEIESISVLIPPENGDGSPRVELVQKIAPWHGVSLGDTRTALLCASGNVFLAGEADFQLVEDSEAYWSVGRRYRA
ncbi:hypothetical protein PEC18_10645 [Paucibacter sp. O1-1]|uniref:hypothetical protein n=1 Tax=Paucibacter sp. M5-1 TaxID=3015998 RepID=UPI0010F652B5|nr:hypothetical protein [Paucibacter sp. M5-1]MCU7371297.1 hypothetical protein [Paucibacter sp. O1-1]MCZ7883159.1 hypothetical protein [Paucibacter sp. M5-1]MDA3826286.1 hypothetical protein [Paucibacter sp. O1-1]